MFTFDQGQISFSLRSRYNLKQRATASSYRAVLDVRDNNPSNHLVYFITQAISGRLVLSYVVGGAAQYYYVPVGTEEELFGSGVTLRVALAWKGNTLNLYLNGTLVKSTAYTPVAANWSSASVFNLGAYEYASYGGYDSCDDVIGNFTIATSAPLLDTVACNPASLGPAAVAACTVTMSGPVASATTIALMSTGAIAVPATVSIAPNASSANFNATAGSFTQDQMASVTASLNAASTTASVALVAPSQITSLQCGSTSLAAADSTNCTVTLSKAAPAGGTGVSLSSSLAALTVPASVLVPSGAISAAFTATAAAVTADHSVTVTAALGVSHAAAVFSVIAPTVITSLECGSTSLAAAASTPCTVTLSKAAPAGGTTVGLASNPATVLAVPESVLVPSGATSATFTASTAASIPTAPSAVIAEQCATLTATLGSSSKSIAMTATSATLSILGSPSEVSGATNGSVVTPTIAPAGLTGTVVTRGSGAVKFAPDQSGNGVYFENCCTNVNNAYYHFTGAALGNVFTFDQGQISFSLRSRYNLKQRATASSYRAVLDVRDNNPSNHLVYFITQAISGRLVLSYVVGGAAQYYYVPVGTEEELFGSGVTLRVALAWKGNTLNLYLNGTLVKSTAYTPVAANWSSASVFNLGAYEYASYGGYDSCDDVIGNFMVGPAAESEPVSSK